MQGQYIGKQPIMAGNMARVSVKKKRDLNKRAGKHRFRRKCFVFGMLLLVCVSVLRLTEELGKDARLRGLWAGGVAVNPGNTELADRDVIYSTLLSKLEDNPELAEFVENYPQAEPIVYGGISQEEREQQFPLFLQWDGRWGYVPYGDDILALSGCAPTCLSMVIYSLTRDDTATPDAIAQYSMDRGHYVYGTGTSWSLMADIPKQYRVQANELSLNQTVMERRLDEGGLIICSMRPGDFTKTGHFIVLYGYNEEGFFVNDPFSEERSSKSWDYEVLSNQIKNLWGYSGGK